MRRWSLIATAAQRLRYSQPSEPLGRLYVTVDPCPDRCCDLPPRRDRGGDGRNLRCTALAALRSELCLHYPMGVSSLASLVHFSPPAYSSRHGGSGSGGLRSWSLGSPCL